jgi:hypothetical protein
LRDLQEARQMVARAEKLRRYEPRDGGKWDDIYGRFREFVG